MMISHWLSPDVAQRLGGSLLHFLWQGAAVGIVAAATLRFMSRRRAESRYAVLVTALFVMFIAPVVTFLFYAQIGAIVFRLLQFVSQESLRPAQSAKQLAANAAWTQWIVWAWFIGVAGCSARLAAGWKLSRQWMRLSTEAVPAKVTHIVGQITERLGIHTPIKVLGSAFLDVPAAVGWLRPAIFLPVAATTGLDEPQLRAIIAHEIAHIRRHDFAVNTVQRCVESVLFFHPAVWWISSQIRYEREHCCDDIAIGICDGNRLLYAQALIELERVRATEPVFAVAATGSSLTQRIRRILGCDTITYDWQAAAATISVVILSVFVGVWQSSTMEAKPATPPAPVSAPSPVAPAESAAQSFATAANAIAAIVTARPAEPTVAQQQAPAPLSLSTATGHIQGTVATAGSAEPIPGVQVTLAGGPADPKAVQELIRAAGNRGIVFAPARIGTVDEVIQEVIDAAAKVGVAPNFPSLRTALQNFRAANAARFNGTSDATGRFTIDDVLSGQYTIHAEREGFFEPPSGVPVQVAGAQTAQIGLLLSPAATISGSVHDASGRPQANLDVIAYSIVYNNGYPTLQPRVTKPTNDRGEFRLFWLPPGEYYLAAVPRPPATPVATAAREQIVRTYFPNVQDVGSAMAVNIKAGDQRPGMDIEIQTVPLAKISGKVTTTIPPEETAASAAAIGAPTGALTAIMLMSRNPAKPDLPGGNTSTIGTIQLNGGTGQFEIGGLLPGEYDLYARLAESNANGGAGFAFGFTSLDIHGEDVTGLSIQVHRTVPVTGVVTLNGNAPQQNTFRLSIQPDGSSTRLGVYQAVAQRPVTAGPDGAFSIIAVPPGRYHVQVGPGVPPDIYIADVIQGVSVFDAGFEVGSEPPGPLRVMLKSGAASIEGTVEDAQGKVFADATVVLVPAPDRRQNRALYHTATSDATGHIMLRNIAPGNYKIFAWQTVPAGAYFNSAFLTRYEGRGHPIALNEKSAPKSEKILVIPAEP